MKPSLSLFALSILTATALIITSCTRPASTQPPYQKTLQVTSPPATTTTSVPLQSPSPITTQIPTSTLPPTVAPSPTEEVAPQASSTPNDSPYLGQHIVQSGETLYMIGRAYQVLPQAIAEANNIPDPNRISPGMVLNIPRVKWENIPSGPVAKPQFTP